ncbi:hypothetical protein ASPTUDRAFT_51064 [Aspergillus tubingensis CBS 134.48]|uniref:Uncharacterized protein n=1 Tax=Aspergillus tubingensis (strain CBS 134.48) TaxID=767770 RepID=A0A1L9NFT7_ASPTC|nr:hypothetical protein ASPTUDRAFT_51064 [Aspergillus tubingensis CBS 134.48]
MKVAPLQTWPGCVVARLSYRLLVWPVENHFRRKKSPRRNTALGSWQTREKLRRTDWSVRRIWTDGSGEQRGLLGLCQSAVTAASSLVNVDCITCYPS